MIEFCIAGIFAALAVAILRKPRDKFERTLKRVAIVLMFSCLWLLVVIAFYILVLTGNG